MNQTTVSTIEQKKLQQQTVETKANTTPRKKAEPSTLLKLGFNFSGTVLLMKHRLQT